MKKNTRGVLIHRGIPITKLKMRLTTILLIVSLFKIQASTYSQVTKISLDMENATVESVLKGIEGQSEFKFFYESNIIDLNKQVSITVKNKKIFRILDQLFKGTSLKYEVLNKHILIKLSKKKAVIKAKPPTNEKVQTAVTGTVADSEGNILPGLNIVIKGTSVGTQTDFDGRYTINVSEGDILVYSYIGFKTQEIAFSGQSSINVVMQEDTATLDEVVVVAFGTQKKSSLTAAVDQVDIADIEERPLRSLADGLQGLIAGLNINAPSGAPEANLNLNIRGFTGLNTQGQPLVLVDGVERNINDINPVDVENISVLKDGAATAIYGSRAPYGIVLITTKSGKKGQKTQITYSTNTRISAITNRPSFPNSWAWAETVNEAFRNNPGGGGNPFFSEEQIDRMRAFGAGDFDNVVFDGLNPSEVPFGTYELSPTQWGGHQQAFGNTNWLDEGIKRSVASQQHDISISGGGEASSYYMGLGYNETKGIFKSIEDFKNRYSVLGRYSVDITDWLTTKLSVNYVRTEEEGPNAFGQGRNYSTIWNVLARSFPSWVTQSPDGGFYRFNSIPQFNGDSGSESLNRNDFTVTGEAVLRPFKGLELTGQYTWRANGNQFSRITLPVFQILPNGNEVLTQRSAPRSSLIRRNGNSTYHTANLFASYNRTIAEKHNFYVLAGYQQEVFNSGSLQVNVSDLFSPTVPVAGLSNSTDNVIERKLDWATQGYFGRLTYNFDEKYFVEFNGRYDATSRFREQDRWGFFPSVSGAWNVANENFWPMQNTVSSFKLRGSWATSGNSFVDRNGNGVQDPSEYYLFFPSIGLSQSNSIALGGSPITQASLPQIVPETLTWEKPTTIGVGLDITAFNNRLELSYDWYQRTTKDQAGPPAVLPEVLGTPVPPSNNTESETRGWEFSVNWRDKAFDLGGKPFNYRVNLRMNDYIGYVTQYEDNGTGAINGQWTVGERFGQNRFYQSNGIIQNASELGSVVPHTPTWIYPGDLSIRDLNGDGIINAGSNGTWYNLGDRPLDDSYDYPRYRYGITLGANWNGFDLNVNMDGVGHWKRFSRNMYVWGTQGAIWFSPYYEEHLALDYWSPDNTDAFYPRNTFNGKNRLETEQYALNLAHLRIRNIRLGYNIPQKILDKIGLNKLNIYVSGENLGFIYYKSFIKFDPQLLAASSGQGYPPSRIYSFGLNIGL